jgi:predicted flap endonuclease-1-like 5' DNA nuclease
MAREKDKMRSDYALYTVAIIFFIMTGIVFVYQTQPVELWIVATTVLGIFFIGLGYTQRPKAKVKTTVAALPSTPTPTQLAPSPPPREAVEEKAVEAVEVAMPAGTPLIKVKGIGEKRAEQLKALGINSVEELAKASADELASKLKISPKITQRWIEDAKRIIEKS